MSTMWTRQRTGSTLCPSCGQLVGVNDAECLNCGRRRPGMMGLTGVLRSLGSWEDGLGPFVMLVCGTLYIASAALSAAMAGEEGGLRGLMSPNPMALLTLGASGSLPVFGLGRWWTVLSAGWLHGNLVHIFFNMMAARTLVPLTAHLYGGARTAIIYVIASVCGFVASSVANAYLGFLPRFLSGGRLTIGASAAIFGLIGAALYYGRRGGSSLLLVQAKQWAVGGLLFGFFVPGIDNWAHLGGLAGGYLLSRWLDPLTPEQGNHVLVALVLLAATGVAIVVSFITPISLR